MENYNNQASTRLSNTTFVNRCCAVHCCRAANRTIPGNNQYLDFEKRSKSGPFAKHQFLVAIEKLDAREVIGEDRVLSEKIKFRTHNSIIKVLVNRNFVTA